VLIAASFLCFACAGDKKPFDLVQGIAAQRGNDILFDLPDPLKVRTARFTGLSVLSVPLSGRAEEIETYWRVQMDPGKYRQPPRVYWPMRYGDEIAYATQVTPAKRLRPGRYRITLDVVIDDMSKADAVRGAKVLVVDFFIGPDLRLDAARSGATTAAD
jgi:hypothetical protein